MSEPDDRRLLGLLLEPSSGVEYDRTKFPGGSLVGRVMTTARGRYGPAQRSKTRRLSRRMGRLSPTGPVTKWPGALVGTNDETN